MNKKKSDEDTLIAQTVNSATSLPSLARSTLDRFQTEVRALLERRAQSGWEGESETLDFSVFIHTEFPRAPFQNDDHPLSPVLDLHATNAAVFGNVFFLSANASNGTKTSLPCDFNEILDWIAKVGLEDCPIILAYRKTLTMTVRSCSNDQEPTTLIIRDKPADLSLDELKLALKTIHECTLITPSVCGAGVWKTGESHKYIPTKQPEKAIQDKLRYALHGWFHGKVAVSMEDKVTKGRIDVRLMVPPEEAKKYGLTYWSIIELKVARSFHSSGNPAAKSSVLNEILKGIGQANEFTKETYVEEGFLEIYDMRQDKSEDLLEGEKVKKKMKKCTAVVNASVRPLYGSSDEAREVSFSEN